MISYFLMFHDRLILINNSKTIPNMRYYLIFLHSVNTSKEHQSFSRHWERYQTYKGEVAAFKSQFLHYTKIRKLQIWECTYNE